MGSNRRYADKIDELGNERYLNGGRRPVRLPKEAEGPERMRWVKQGAPVWVWVTWTDGSTSRIPTVALGWNDRVVFVRVPGGEATVWRSAVTHRADGEAQPS